MYTSGFSFIPQALGSTVYRNWLLPRKAPVNARFITAVFQFPPIHLASLRNSPLLTQRPRILSFPLLGNKGSMRA